MTANMMRKSSVHERRSWGPDGETNGRSVVGKQRKYGSERLQRQYSKVL